MLSSILLPDGILYCALCLFDVMINLKYLKWITQEAFYGKYIVNRTQ